MEFTINKSDIRNILSKVQGLTGRRTNLAITEAILIKTAESGITMIATDLETGFEGTYPATVESEGQIAINAKKLYEIVRDFPTDDIRINEVENRWIKIGNQSIEYHIVGMDPEDFPDTPHIEDVEFFEIDSAPLKKMIEKTVIISGAADDKRSHINGIYFERILTEDKKTVRMVSTDGSRLATADYVYENDAKVPEGPGILIPKKGLNEVSKFLGGNGTVQVGLKDNHFIIKKDPETIIIRLLEGDFPRYNDIIAKGDGCAVKIDRHPFLMMLKRMSILSSENYKGVIFNFSDSKLTVTAANPDIGESKEEMPVEFAAEEIKVAFNPKYFIEMLGVIEDDNVLLHIVDERRPCLIEGENDKSYLGVIMPMRI
jgi:DNA polymerase-3 subunit beta